MKKIFSLLVVSLILLVYACGGGGDDPKAVMSDLLDTMEGFFEGLDKAENAEDIVAAMEKFSSNMQALVPKMKALREKFDLTGMKDGNLPEEFKEFEERFKAIQPKFMGIMGKIVKFANDPKVQAAQQKMMEALSTIQ